MIKTFEQQKAKWVADAETVDIPLKSIDDTESNQMRADGTDEVTVAQYAEIMSLNDKSFPPVILGFHNDNYIILDGFHRVGAAKQLNRTSIEAKVLKELSLSQCRQFAMTSNLRHGKPASNKDKAQNCKRLLANHFAEYVDNYDFKAEHFYKYFGFSKTLVYDLSKARRDILRASRDIRAIHLKRAGRRMEAIGQDIGTSRKGVTDILKKAKGSIELVTPFKELLIKLKGTCDDVLKYETLMLEPLGLPSPCGIDTTISRDGIASGHYWNNDDEDLNDLIYKLHENPLYECVDQAHGDCCDYHNKYLIYPSSEIGTDFQVAHAAACLYDDEYAALYEYWLTKTFGDQEHRMRLAKIGDLHGHPKAQQTAWGILKEDMVGLDEVAKPLLRKAPSKHRPAQKFAIKIR